MTNTTDPTAEGDLEDQDPNDPITHRQFRTFIDHFELTLKQLRYNTLDADDKITLLTIETLGMVYAVISIGYLIAALFLTDLSLSSTAQNLQNLLVVFVILFGMATIMVKLTKVTSESLVTTIRERPTREE